MNSSSTFNWQRCCRVVLLVVGVACTLVGIFATMETAYETQFADYFAEGTAASRYSYMPIPDRLRLLLECAILLSMGGCLLFSSRLLRRNQLRLAVIWAIAGPILGILIAMLGRTLKANGY